MLTNDINIDPVEVYRIIFKSILREYSSEKYYYK